MLRKITRAEILKMISSLDNRTNKFTDEDFNYVMDMGYAELATIVHAFNNEEIVSMDEFYEAGETKLTLDIEEDVAYIYDMYLTVENQTDLIRFPHGIRKLVDENVIYKDSRYVGRVHINLDNINKITYEKLVVNNAVMKYAFTPTHTTESIYIDQPTYLAMRDAFGCALYNKLNDTERESQKRASLGRTAARITPAYPDDFRIDVESNIADEGRISIAKLFHGLGV